MNDHVDLDNDPDEAAEHTEPAPQTTPGTTEPTLDSDHSANEEPDASGTVEEDSTPPESNDDEPDETNPNREAAKYRKRLREAEQKLTDAQTEHETAIEALTKGHTDTVAQLTTERDSLAELLARTRESIVDQALTAADIDPRLFTAAGHTIDGLLAADELIDPEKLNDAVTDTRAMQTPPARRPAPNPLVGGGSDAEPAESGKEVWARAFGARTG